MIEHLEGVGWVFAPCPCAVEHRLELLAASAEELVAGLAFVGQGDDQAQDRQPGRPADVVRHAGRVGAQVTVQTAGVRDR